MSTRHDPYEALRVPAYARFLLGMICLYLGALIQSTAVGWQVYLLTKDYLSLGYVGLAEAVPFLSLTLIGGWASDQMDRRNLCLWGQLILLAGALWLLALASCSKPPIWHFYAIQALAGVGRAFFRPASIALSTELVNKEQMMNAATWRTTTWTVASVTGPALGGLLVGVGGPKLAYGTMVTLLLLGLIMLFSLRPAPRVKQRKKIGEGLWEGARFVWHHQLILGALSLDMFSVLFGGAIGLLPAFAKDILNVDSFGFGLLRAAPSAGAILMSLALAHWPLRKRIGGTLLWSVTGFGLSWILFALSRNYAWSMLLLGIGGALDAVSMVIRSTLLQTLTPEALMGRVMAVNSFFIGSSNELGSYESGLAAKILGLVPSVIFGGVMTLATVLAVARRAPQLRAMDHFSGD